MKQRISISVVTIIATISCPGLALADVMYKCMKPDYVDYGFQARSDANCTVLTMSDAYREGVVLKELNLVCSGTEKLSGPQIPESAGRHTASFHLGGGRWNGGPCSWTERNIFCGTEHDHQFGLPVGNHTLAIDRYAGSVREMLIMRGAIRNFEGNCEIKSKPKF